MPRPQVRGFIEIQKRIVSFADSFYWLRYLSPKRGDRERTLALSVKGNEVNYTIEGSFNSINFYSVRPEVFVNRSPSNAEGIEELRIAEGDTVRLEAVTYPELKSPQYSWESSDSDIVAIKPDPADAAVGVGDCGWGQRADSDSIGVRPGERVGEAGAGEGIRCKTLHTAGGRIAGDGVDSAGNVSDGIASIGGGS